MKMTFAAMRQQKRVSTKTPDMRTSTKKVFKKTNFEKQMNKMNYLELPPAKQTKNSKLAISRAQNKSSELSDSSRNSKKYISRQEKIDKKIK